MYILPYISLNGFGRGCNLLYRKTHSLSQNKIHCTSSLLYTGVHVYFSTHFFKAKPLLKITGFIQITLYWSSYIIAVTILKYWFIKCYFDSNSTVSFIVFPKIKIHVHLISHMQFYFNWKFEFSTANSGLAVLMPWLLHLQMNCNIPLLNQQDKNCE